MTPSYFISTLLYCFDDADKVLLMQRNREPNRGLWSPCGGKLITTSGESPHACAVREAKEELGFEVDVNAVRLTGVISESGASHWLMFLFELKPRLTVLPEAHPEGNFRFFRRDELNSLSIPETDRERIWPLFWEHRGGFFAAHCASGAGSRQEWVVLESRPSRDASPLYG